MSLLIKGIDLPEAYTSAWLTVFECVGEHTFIKTHKVSAEQMQAIPPHGRLIDADELQKIECLFKDLNCFENFMYNHGVGDCIAIIRNAPTIIEAEEGEQHE